MRKCTRCKKIKPLEEFKKDKATSSGYGWLCIPCARTSAREYYHSRSDTKKKQYSQAKHRAVLRNQVWICEYLYSHPCEDCGESNIEVLEFDHLPQYEKYSDLCAMIRSGRSIANLEKEIEKCEVVCANCHRKRTNRRGNNYRLRFIQGTLVL